MGLLVRQDGYGIVFSIVVSGETIYQGNTVKYQDPIVIASQLNSVQVEVGIMAFCERQGLSLPLRLVLFMTALNNKTLNDHPDVQPGINHWLKQDILEAVTQYGIMTSAQFYKALRINRKLGQPFFEEKTDKAAQPVIHVKGTKALFRWVYKRTLKQGDTYVIPLNGVATIPLSRIADRLKERDWTRLVYEVYLQATTGQPIARQSIQTATGISPETQRKYDTELGVISHARWVIEGEMREPTPGSIPQRVGNIYHVNHSSVIVTPNRGWRLYVQTECTAYLDCEGHLTGRTPTSSDRSPSVAVSPVDGDPTPVPVECPSQSRFVSGPAFVDAIAILYEHKPKACRNNQRYIPNGGPLIQATSPVLYTYDDMLVYETEVKTAIADIIKAKNRTLDLSLLVAA